MLTYVIGSTSFAVLCSLVWLVLGGSIVSALVIYLVAGELAMISLIGINALRYKADSTGD